MDAKIPEKVAAVPDKPATVVVTNQTQQIPFNQRISPRGQPLPAANQSANVPKPSVPPAVPATDNPIIPSKGAKVSVPTFNILDSMKKVNVSMSLWDSLSIPGQKDLLQSALHDLTLSSEPSSNSAKVILTNAEESPAVQTLV